MKQIKKKKYALGSFIKPLGKTGGGIAQAGNLLGSAIGGPGGNMLSGIASGAMAGGPLGAAIGGIGAIIGNIGEQKRLKKQEAAEYKAFNDEYQQNLIDGQDTLNENPYGQVFADGGDIVSKLKRDVKYSPQGYLRNSKTNPNIQDVSNKIKTDIKKGIKKDFEQSRSLKIFESALKILDPTGLSSHEDVKQVWNDGKFDYQDIIEPLGALPVIGKFGKIIKTSSGMSASTLSKLSTGLINLKKGTDTYEAGKGIFEDGGMVPEDNQINIEKGELQINPETGKILREYNGINPETGGLYAPHSKGKDTKHNIVGADPGSFIITAAKAKLYKDAIDNKDKLLQNTVLQNIRNYKDSKEAKTNKFKLGSFVSNPKVPKYAQQIADVGKSFGIPGVNMNALLTNVGNAGFGAAQQGVGDKLISTESSFDKVIDGVGTYGNALYNVGQGLFGKVDKTPNVGVTKNPYKNDIINNMPQDINFEPVRQQLLRNQNSQFSQIDNTTSGSPIARANKQNVFANTQNQLGNLMMQNQINNNQVKSQRAGIYGNLGAQEMEQINRTQQINLGINDQNLANKGAKRQLLDKGLSQVQQAYQNNKLNKSKQGIDKYKVNMLQEMFPNLKHYPNFDYDTFFKQING